MDNQTPYDKAQQAIEWCRDHQIDWAGFWLDSSTISFGYLTHGTDRLAKVIAAMSGHVATKENGGSTDDYEVKTDAFTFRWNVWKRERAAEVELVTIGDEVPNV